MEGNKTESGRETSTEINETQTKEVDNIKQTYQKGQCRIIKDLGDFTHVVTLQPTDENIVYKFQLKNTYPKALPNIIIRSPALKENELKDLQTQLEEKAVERVGTPMIMELVFEAENWIREHEIDMKRNVSKTEGKHTTVYKQKGKKDKGKHRQRKQEIEDKETENEKKPSMKTAEDVINRILWDGNIPRDEFLVGYIDRFTGLQEKYFTAFSWEDIASVDYNVLAVPKHRIQYFKYKDVKIWDKSQRLDNVFGSLGSNTTLYDVIEKYESGNNETVDGENKETNVETSNNSEETDSDSDDDIVVTVGNAASNFNDIEVDEEEAAFQSDEDESYDKYWRDKMRPNHFLALRITDEDIKSMTDHIQDSIVEYEPKYEECCIPSSSLHLTLCTVGLDTPEQVSNAVQVLKNIKPELEGFVPKDKKIVIRKVEQFFNRVIYAKAECPPEFLQMVDHLKLCLRENGIEIRDNHEFVPHMTIMKVSRPVARSTGKKYVAPWLYSGHSDVEFGSQEINNLHLCEMGIGRRDDGFYLTPTSLELSIN